MKKQNNMPTHKSARELLESCVSDCMIQGFGDSKPRDKRINQALASLAELVRGQKEEIQDSQAGQDYEIGWNSAIDHIALLIEGKQGKGE